MTFNCSIPATSTVQRDDPDIRITRWDFEPGAATGWHRHDWTYLVVMLTDSIMQVHDGSKIVEFARKAGDTYSRLAGVEHDVMNGSQTPMAFVEIEIKRSQALA